MGALGNDTMPLTLGAMTEGADLPIDEEEYVSRQSASAAAEDGSTRRTGSGRRRLSMVVAVVLLAAVAGGGLWWANRSEPSPVAAPPSADIPVSEVDPTPSSDVWLTTIATSRVPELTVLQTLPAGTELDDEEVERRKVAEASYASFGAPHSTNTEIPSIEEAVVGRFRTPTGWMFSNPTENGQPRVFRVTEDHGEWLKIQLPARPNNTEGWVNSADVELSTTHLHIRVDISDRQLTLYDGKTVLQSHSVGVGKDVTPTPTGRVYITDKVEKYEGSSYGRWILQLSGFSTALDDFSGGAPALAIHGSRNPDDAGKQVSNGCVRVPGEAITELANAIGLGTPVDIVD